MSSIVVAGDTSGSITLQAPGVAGSAVLTLPVATDTLVGKATTDTLTNKTLTSPTITGATITVASTAAPAFSAYATTVSTIPNVTWTKLTFDTENFDTNSNFASSRFTPTVAGYYQLSTSWQAGFTTSFGATAFYKNSSLWQYVTFTSATSVGVQSGGSALMYLNGTSDYVEVFAYQATGGALNNTASSSPLTWFSGAMVRSA